MRQLMNMQLCHELAQPELNHQPLQRILLYEHRQYRDCRACRCRQD